MKTYTYHTLEVNEDCSPLSSGTVSARDTTDALHVITDYLTASDLWPEDEGDGMGRRVTVRLGATSEEPRLFTLAPPSEKAPPSELQVAGAGPDRKGRYELSLSTAQFAAHWETLTRADLEEIKNCVECLLDAR